MSNKLHITAADFRKMQRTSPTDDRKRKAQEIEERVGRRIEEINLLVSRTAKMMRETNATQKEFEKLLHQFNVFARRIDKGAS